MKKAILIAAVLCLSISFLQAQEAAAPQDGESSSASQNQNSSQAQDSGAAGASSKWYNLFDGSFVPPKNGKEFLSQISPFVNVGANIIINTESELKSAPNPTAFALSFGAIWPNKAFVSFQPRLSFWWSYHLWDGENALPAEIENRTAFALNFMFDLPAVATFRFNRCQLEAGLGLGILARVALLAGGVEDSDAGASGSAGGDKEKIQEWFWSGARFLYPELFVAWEWNFTPRIAAGLEARWYIPIGSLINARGLDASIIALSAKLIF